MTTIWRRWGAVSLTALALLGTGAFAQSAPAAPSADLEELAGRLLGYGFDEPELIVGALPPSMPFEVALPAGARLIGSSVRGGDDMEIVMDVRDTAESIQAFYAGRLTGFENKGSTDSNVGGFVFSATATGPAYQSTALYCKDDLSFTIVVYRLDAAIKDVRLRINSYDCEYNAPSGLTLPTLTPPANARVRSISRGYGQDISSSMRLETTLTPAELLAYYSGLMTAAGWQSLDAATLKTGAVGAFEYKDASGKTWRLLMTIVSDGKGMARASLQAFGV